MKPTYYYTLYPDTFLWINETEGVMYNAKEHTYLSFDIHGLIKKYCWIWHPAAAKEKNMNTKVLN